MNEEVLVCIKPWFLLRNCFGYKLASLAFQIVPRLVWKYKFCRHVLYLVSSLATTFFFPVASKAHANLPLLSVEAGLLTLRRRKEFCLICSTASLWTKKKFKNGCTRWDPRFIQLSIWSLTMVGSRCLQKSKRTGLACMTFALGSFRLQLLVAQRFSGQKIASLYLLSLNSRNSPSFSSNPCKFLASTVSCGCINTRAC